MFQSDVFSNQWCDIVFENREKNYGAYVLRKKDAHNTVVAFFISSMAFIGIACTPIILQWLTPRVEEVSIPPVIPEIIDFKYPPKQTIEITCPPKHTPTVKSTRPASTFKITDDNEIKPDERLKPEPDKNATGHISDVDGDNPADLTDGLPDIRVIETGEKNDTIYRFVEQAPQYPGGEVELLKFISSNVKYPKVDIEFNNQGKVFVSFVVDKNGNVTAVEAPRGPSKAMIEEAIRVVKMMPQWQPGKHNGNPVNVRFSLPVAFTLK